MSKLTQLTGKQLQEKLRTWLSPPDSSINHNNACKMQHTGTAMWFIQGSTFQDWKKNGSLMWIRGNRAFLLLILPFWLLIPSQFSSWCRKERSLVRDISSVSMVKLKRHVIGHRSALPLLRTSGRFEKSSPPWSHTITLTIRMPISAISMACCRPLSSNSVTTLIVAGMSFWNCTERAVMVSNDQEMPTLLNI